MKKQMSLFIWAVAVFGMSPVWAATNSGMRAASSADLTGGPATRTRQNVTDQKYETRTSTRTYDMKDAGDLYYTAPTKRSALYKQYDNSGRNGAANVRMTRAETTRTAARRKYYLAHPFFQPLQGKFGSITDLSYNMNSYDMAFSNPTSIIHDANGNALTLNEASGKWDMKQFSIKEDFSYGITDRIAVLAMLKYDVSKYKFEWSNGPDDKMDDNGLNMFGAGAQWRFVDNDKWIATLSGYYQHQKDVSDNVILDIKGGYKYGKSTIYGLLRGWYVDLDGNAYGNGVSGKDGEGYDATMFVAYKTNTDNAMYVEGGVGVFSVLDEDWTLNVEGIFGNYDWHNQASLKAAIGWQPNDWFALNLYAKTAIYDSADDKNLEFYYWRANTFSADGAPLTGLSRFGDAKVDKYSETNIGVQAIFYF